ncbi:MAG: hypothetical protein CL414_08105 [Acidimicrobiaceae bacterium]|nr:hypothetical protein [Acidimicrobiaceae bacterium]
MVPYILNLEVATWNGVGVGIGRRKAKPYGFSDLTTPPIIPPQCSLTFDSVNRDRKQTSLQAVAPGFCFEAH